MVCRYSLEAKGPADFSGYWRLAKTENFDLFLQDLGLPWVVRKAAVKFGGNAIDVISHAGSVMKVTSLNAKGSWTRQYDTEREVTQRNAEGVPCRTRAWWEGRVFRTRLEGSPLGPCESWRFMSGGIMVVKTAVALPNGEASMYWYYEMMEVLHRHLGGQGRYHLLRRIERDQRQVEKATRGDNRYLQKVLLDFDRWASPADEFITVASPTYSRRKMLASHAGSPHVSQGNLSKSPSASSLGSPLDLRSEGRSGRSEVGSRSRLGSESTSALDRATMADLARADKMVAAAAAASATSGHPPRAPARPTSPHGAAEPGGGPSGASSPTAAPAAAQQQAEAAAPAAQPGDQQQQQQQQRHPQEFYREISLSIRPGEGMAGPEGGGREAANGPLPDPAAALRPVRARSPQRQQAAEDDGGVTFQLGEVPEPPPSPPSLRFVGAGAGAGRPPLGPGVVAGSRPSVTSELGPPPSDMATVGSGSVTEGVELGPGHVRVASAGSLGGMARAHHRKNLSGEAIGSEGRVSVRPTPRSTPTHRQMPSNGEQLLAFKAHEYLDSRGITAVVPVTTPNDTSEPELLCMSPEQAEQTHAKLRELEEEMLLQRQEYRKGITCCGCVSISWVSSSLPDHLRTWEMSLS